MPSLLLMVSCQLELFCHSAHAELLCSLCSLEEEEEEEEEAGARCLLLVVVLLVGRAPESPSAAGSAGGSAAGSAGGSAAGSAGAAGCCCSPLFPPPALPPALLGTPGELLWLWRCAFSEPCSQPKSEAAGC